jgi:hypothetical protein
LFAEDFYSLERPEADFRRHDPVKCSVGDLPRDHNHAVQFCLLNFLQHSSFSAAEADVKSWCDLSPLASAIFDGSDSAKRFLIFV